MKWAVCGLVLESCVTCGSPFVVHPAAGWAAVQTQGFQIEGWEHSAVSVVITGSPWLLG